MYEIIIATHGKMAEGMKQSLTMFTDQLDHVHTLCLDEQGVHSFECKADMLIEQCRNQDTLVLCDIGFATPFNVFAQRIQNFHKDVEVIAGINMPALLEAVIMQPTTPLKDVVQNFQNTIKPISLKEQLQNASNYSDDE